MWDGPTDTELILLIIGFLYISECLQWLPRQTICLTGWSGRWRITGSPEFLGHGTRGLFLASLCPLGRAITCPNYPVALAEGGCAILSGEHFGRFVSIEQFEALRRFRGQISFSNGVVINFSNDQSAESFAILLQRLAAADHEQRQGMIAHWLDLQFDESTIVSRIDEVLDRSSSSRWLGAMMFFYVFAYGPALYYMVENPDEWLLVRYLLGALILEIGLIVTFWFAHRSLFGKAVGGRWKTAFLMLLSPAMSMRSGDHLARFGVFAGHPIVLGRRLLGNSDWLRLARSVWTDLVHPLPVHREGDCVVSDADPTLQRFEETRASFAKQIKKRIEAACDFWAVNLESLTCVPRRDHDASSYCRRCHNQFRESIAQCEDCNGLRTVPFSD